jgi:hypothetical protein
MAIKSKVRLTIGLLIAFLVSRAFADHNPFVGASVSGTADLQAFFFSGHADWEVIDLSTIAGQKFSGSAVTWQTRDGPFTVEHVAGVNASGDLIVFFWSTEAESEENWDFVNVSEKTQQKVAGPVTNWQTQDGPFTVEHLAGASPSGDLLVFFWSPQADWQFVNVSEKTQQKIVGSLTSWQRSGNDINVEHVASASPEGDLLVFRWSPESDWQVVNVSNIVKQKISGTLTSWITRGTEFVAAAGPEDHGFNVFWSFAFERDLAWGVCDISMLPIGSCSNSLHQ